MHLSVAQTLQTPLAHMSSGNGRTPSREFRNTRKHRHWAHANLNYSYWMFLAYFVAVLAVIHLTPISESEGYINMLGYIGLAVEATLPIPQILANQRSGSCKGFRVSVLAAWLIGDTMKMGYFFCSEEDIPWAFKICGIFQCICDFYLGFQYLMFSRNSKNAAGSSHGEEEEDRWGTGEKDIRMT